MKSLQVIKSWKFHQLFVFDCFLMFIQLATIQVAWPIKSSIGLPDIIRVASEHGGETSFSPKLRHSCDKRCTHVQRKNVGQCWIQFSWMAKVQTKHKRTRIGTKSLPNCEWSFKQEKHLLIYQQLPVYIPSVYETKKIEECKIVLSDSVCLFHLVA